MAALLGGGGSAAAAAAGGGVGESQADDNSSKPAKSNKMGNKMMMKPSGGSGSGQSGLSLPSTPLLDALPPLRRAQFLQIVLRQVKVSGGHEADKLILAEEYLSKNGGDYDKAYQYVKALADGSSQGA